MSSDFSLPSPVESVSLDLSREDGGIETQTQTQTQDTQEVQDMQDTQGEPTEAGTGEEAGATESVPAKDVMTASSQSPSRNRLARSHFRSRSLAEVPRVPPMTRAYSSPGLDSRGRYIFGNGRGTSMSSNSSSSSSKENNMANGLQATTSGVGDLESKMAPLTISEPIAEHAELDLEPGARAGTSIQQQQQQHHHHQQHHTFPRMGGGRRRPSSPLHVQPGNNNVGSQAMGSPTLSSKYNESFPAYSSSSASSMPSTPTSVRSRSPSISSLETIPDIPDAEAAASETDQVAALKAAADRDDDGGNRRRTYDASGPILRFGRAKRWSVCGAERRQDLDLETIWED